MACLINLREPTQNQGHFDYCVPSGVGVWLRDFPWPWRIVKSARTTGAGVALEWTWRPGASISMTLAGTRPIYGYIDVR